MNKKIRCLLVAGTIWYFGEGMLGPLFAIFAERVGGDILDVTWAWAIFLIFAGGLNILIGKITQKDYSKTKLMVLGYALNTIFTFCYLLVDTPLKLFFLQAGLGIASALATPTWDTLYSKFNDKKQDSFEWGLVSGGAEISTGIAIIIGGLIVTYFSFTALFITMGIIQTIATIYQAKILTKKRFYELIRGNFKK